MGDDPAAAGLLQQARGALPGITEADDRALVEADLRSLTARL